MAAYVIRSWRADTQLDENSHFVTIKGRREGIISWMLALFRIDPTVTITVSDTHVEFSEASLSGSVRRLIPLAGICSTLYGYHKPWKEALGILFMVTWLASRAISIISDGPPSDALFYGLIFGLILSLVYYFLNRTLTLGFVENSGVISSIEFKRSVVENQDINEAQAGHVCEIVQAAIDAKERPMRLA